MSYNYLEISEYNFQINYIYDTDSGRAIPLIKSAFCMARGGCICRSVAYTARHKRLDDGIESDIKKQARTAMLLWIPSKRAWLPVPV